MSIARVDAEYGGPANGGSQENALQIFDEYGHSFAFGRLRCIASQFAKDFGNHQSRMSVKERFLD